MSGYAAEYDTPSILASEAILLLHSKIEIAAPASTVFRTIRNTETWRDWNRFVPKVNITFQPLEEDSATAAEIQQIVRNTSIIGSFYSDLTEGGPSRPKSPDDQPPPRFRLNSISSQMSQEDHRPRRSESVDPLAPRGSIASVDSTSSPRKSGSQLFQETHAPRRSSVASGDELDMVRDNVVENTHSHRASVALPSSPVGKSKSDKKQRVSSSVSARSSAAMAKTQQAIMTVYGEPSVRLQIKTKLVFYTRMKPMSLSEYTEVNMIVTEIARPDYPILEKGTTALTRAKTHHLDRAGHYRIVWANDTDGASLLNFTDVFRGSKVPKYLLQTERVHEIVPTGDDTCIYHTWELQKGHSAKSTKKKHGDHLQKMFDIWAFGLKEFCEGLHPPKIDRRDFSIPSGDVPKVVLQTLD